MLRRDAIMKNKVIGAAAGKAANIIGNTKAAAATPGEMMFTGAIPAMQGVLSGVEQGGPLKYFFSGVGRLLKGIIGVFRDKKKLISVIVVSLLWLALMLLPSMGLQQSKLKWLDFLTFSRGGTSGGLLGSVGGLAGKGLFAYFIFSVALPVFSGGRPFAGTGSGLKRLFSSMSFRDKSALVPLLSGAGIALAVYNFLTGNALLINSMAGIAAFFVSLRALANKGGFLRGFLTSIIRKFSRKHKPDASVINRFMAGCTAGFVLGVALSITGISTIGYIGGCVILIAAVVIKIVTGGRKGELSK
jgi:hypothetical protein